MRLFALAAAAFAVLVSGVDAAAEAASSARREGVRFRLLLMEDDQARPAAALEVRLDPGWKFFWRSPGPFGIRPVFDFSRSTAIRAALPGWPTPTRLSVGGGSTPALDDIIGYTGRVMFPIAVERTALAGTAVLRLALDYGVCADVCIPDRVELDARIRAEADRKGQALVSVARARMQLPRSDTLTIQSAAAVPAGDAIVVDFALAGDRPEDGFLEFGADDPAGRPAFKPLSQGWRATFPVAGRTLPRPWTGHLALTVRGRDGGHAVCVTVAADGPPRRVACAD